MQLWTFICHFSEIHRASQVLKAETGRIISDLDPTVNSRRQTIL